MRVLFRDGQQGFAEFALERRGFLRSVLDIHAAVERHLIVAAAARVQALARVADALDEQLFHVHVDILRIQLKLYLTRRDIRFNAFQSFDNRVRIGLRNDPLLAKHRRVRNRSGDILMIKPLVKGDGRMEVIDKPVGFLFKASAPEFHENLLVYVKRGTLGLCPKPYQEPEVLGFPSSASRHAAKRCGRCRELSS